EAARNLMRVLDVTRPYRGRQAVVRVIHPLDHFLHAVKRRYMAHWAEYLFAHAAGIVRQPGPDGRLHIGAGIALIAELRNAATRDDRRTLLFSHLKITQHLVAMHLVYHRPHVDIRIIGVADPQAFRLVFKRANEAIKNRALDIPPSRT